MWPFNALQREGRILLDEDNLGRVLKARFSLNMKKFWSTYIFMFLFLISWIPRSNTRTPLCTWSLVRQDVMATTENSCSSKRHSHLVWSNHWEKNSVKFFVTSQQPKKVGVIFFTLQKRKLKLKEIHRGDITDGISMIKAILGVPRKAETAECTHRYANLCGNANGKEPISRINLCEYECLEGPSRPSANWKPWKEGIMAQSRCKSL